MLVGKNDLVPSTKYTHGEVNIKSAAVYYALRYFFKKIRLTDLEVFTTFLVGLVAGWLTEKIMLMLMSA